VKNKIVHDVVDFVKGHQLLIDQVLREDVSEADELTMEQINLVVGILSKVIVLEDLFWASLKFVSGFMLEILSHYLVGWMAYGHFEMYDSVNAK
jgi:regulator of sigma D